MNRVMLKSKIYDVRVTETDINCAGSITIDTKLMEEADLFSYEQVHVLNINNGQRFVTYVIPGHRGQICINGAASRLAVAGDSIIILSYYTTDEQPIKTRMVKA